MTAEKALKALPFIPTSLAQIPFQPQEMRANSHNGFRWKEYIKYIISQSVPAQEKLDKQHFPLQTSRQRQFAQSFEGKN